MSDQPTTVPHSRFEDVLGVVTGAFVASFGLSLLAPVAAVTGGTAGVALLVSYIAPLPFGVLYAVVNLPFLALALWQKGAAFTARSVVAVALVSVFSVLHPRLIPIGDAAPAYAVVAGNLLVGIGLLIIFRHGSSLGGFNVVALLAQERMGLRAGYVQLALDTCVVLLALTVTAPLIVLLSAIGAVVLNLVLAINHRPGRYLGT